MYLCTLITQINAYLVEMDSIVSRITEVILNMTQIFIHVSESLKRRPIEYLQALILQNALTML